MKKNIFIAGLIGSTIALMSCKKPADPHAGHEMPPGQLSGASLYQFHDMFTDQNGKSLMLHQLEGKYVVLSMFYATCTAICPRIAAEMLRLEKSLSASQKAKTRFVMISFDHERDNPAALKKFIEKMRLTDLFTLLSGNAESVREVSAALGISYKKLPASVNSGRDSYEYSHSSMFTLLSPKGEIVLQHAGLSVDIDAFSAKIGK